MRRAIIFVALMSGISAALAQNEQPDPSQYERILVPVYYGAPVPGAFGSRWNNELTVRNAGDEPVALFQSGCTYFCTCLVAICSTEAFRPVQPGQPYGRGFGYVIVNDPYVPNPGVFLYARRGLADNVAFHLRIYDESRSGATFGTEIPVVRERDFRTGTTWLMNVPLDERFRAHLRIYGISSPSREGAVRVRIYRVEGSDALFDQVMTFRGVYVEFGGGLPTRTNIFAPYPGYAEVPRLRDAVSGQSSERVRVRIDSMTPELQYWAFVSVTNNETQHVTTITPQ